MPCIKNVLTDATKILANCSDLPQLDAEVLLCLTLKKERTYLRTWPDKELEAEQETTFWEYLKKRQLGTPVAYLTGTREFWSRDFLVTPDVLIPRADTELLVELCLSLIPSNAPSSIIDLGTGSGIIAITLAAEYSHVQVTATDYSFAALHIAQLNAKKHNINNIQFIQSDWFNEITPTQYHLIVSNPPYIAPDDEHLIQGDLRFEPLSALRSDEHGLRDIKIIAETAPRYLLPQGYLLVEHGYDQQQAVQALFKENGFSQIQTFTDLSGQPRVTRGQWL